MGNRKQWRWRCFHCSAVFKNRERAAEHFGSNESKTAACQIKDYEVHLIAYIRKLEDQLDRYRAEDGDILRSIYAQESDHLQALAAAEEVGYARGLREAGHDMSGYDEQEETNESRGH